MKRDATVGAPARFCARLKMTLPRPKHCAKSCAVCPSLALRRRQPDRRPHRPVEEGVGARLRRPDRLVETAEQHHVGVHETRFEEAENLEPGMRFVGSAQLRLARDGGEEDIAYDFASNRILEVAAAAASSSKSASSASPSSPAGPCPRLRPTPLARLDAHRSQSTRPCSPRRSSIGLSAAPSRRRRSSMSPPIVLTECAVAPDGHDDRGFAFRNRDRVGGIAQHAAGVCASRRRAQDANFKERRQTRDLRARKSEPRGGMRQQRGEAGGAARPRRRRRSPAAPALRLGRRLRGSPPESSTATRQRRSSAQTRRANSRSGVTSAAVSSGAPALRAWRWRGLKPPRVRRPPRSG